MDSQCFPAHESRCKTMSYLLMHAETRAILLEELDRVRTRVDEASCWLAGHTSTRERLICLHHLEKAHERLLIISEVLSRLSA